MIKSNVLKILELYGLHNECVIYKEDEDRVWAFPVNDTILKYVVFNGWQQDPPDIAMRMHNTRAAFREPGLPIPCLQICFHLKDEGYLLEMDVDIVGPSFKNPAKLLLHGIEVLSNAVWRQKTKQDRIAELLERRIYG